MVFYDPRLPAIQYFALEIMRSKFGEEIEEVKKYQIKELAEVETIVRELSNF